MGGKEKDFIKEAFDTNWIAPSGTNIEGFESDLERYLSMGRYVAALNSGTAAIHLALKIIGIENGDEVICQDMTFSASANPIIYQGAIPIFVDSERESWNISPDHLEHAIKNRILKGKKPKAIIAVHLYGMPFKVDEIISISRKYDIPLIEDSAESLGSSYDGKKCGSFGDLAILSFNGNKVITTSGGGALVTPKESIKKKAIFYATQARDNAPHYQHSEIGYNYRLSNVCAGIGRGQMQVLDEHVVLRRKMNEFYEDLFKDCNGVDVFKEPSELYYSNHWLSCIQVDEKKSGFTSEDIRVELEKSNIESRPIWKPMHLQPVFKEFPYYGERISEELFSNGLCLPSGSNLNQLDRNRIKVALTKFI
jgi:dTDP-4-amino-4,6-dideoxygalactose transaminase